MWHHFETTEMVDQTAEQVAASVGVTTHSASREVEETDLRHQNVLQVQAVL